MINKSNLRNLRSFSVKAQRVISKHFSSHDEVRPYYDGDEVIGILVSTKYCEFVIDLHDLDSKLDFYDAMRSSTLLDGDMLEAIEVNSKEIQNLLKKYGDPIDGSWHWANVESDDDDYTVTFGFSGPKYMEDYTNKKARNSVRPIRRIR